MPNHLIHETSPYLLQHAHNPVEWYPWGTEALQKALQEEKPIFLSVGYSACHWCHVMAHESFENNQIAAILNENFINIKVDREERPDLDAIYMSALVSMTGQGGWPMSLFLTPHGQPFYAGTYFPPARRYGMPSFFDIISSLSEAWKGNRDNILQVAADIHKSTEESQFPSTQEKTIPLESILKQAVSGLIQSYDHLNGGWGKSPKFPSPMSIEFLLQQATRGNTQALEIACHNLYAMARGGMYDLIGGGFHRYSTDNEWLVPHFEKMLYDNAQLSFVYLHAYHLSHTQQFRSICEETLDFIHSELQHPKGGFFSSLDADTQGKEGLFYLWEQNEIHKVMKDHPLADKILEIYRITQNGNFEGKNIPQKPSTDYELANQYHLPESEFQSLLKDANQRLKDFRNHRVHPAVDDKIITFWNALTLRAFAEAARLLQRADYLKIAQENATFILEYLHPKDRLLRSWRNGRANQSAFLEDYAALIAGLLSLYQADFDLRWYHSALQMASEMWQFFKSESTGFYDTGSDQELLIRRPMQLQDNAVPSGNALAAYSLTLLSAYDTRQVWLDEIENAIRQIAPYLTKYPTAFSCWLQLVDMIAGPFQQVVITYPSNSDQVFEWIQYISSVYHPRSVIAAAAFPPRQPAPDIFSERPPINNHITAYICEGPVCSLPIQDLNHLKALFPKNTSAE